MCLGPHFGRIAVRPAPRTSEGPRLRWGKRFVRIHHASPESLPRDDAGSVGEKLLQEKHSVPRDSPAVARLKAYPFHLLPFWFSMFHFNHKTTIIFGLDPSGTAAFQ